MNTTPASSILYVRLPCWKIYPGGVVYLADHVHKHQPGIRQSILDLALVPEGERKRALRERLETMRPDMVAFSWRNMQSFGPHPEDDALDVVMNFDHSPKLFPRLRAAGDALGIIYDYLAGRLRNFQYMRMARRLLPRSRIVVGGTAVAIFGQFIVRHCPRNTFAIMDEGEDTMLSLAQGD